jgi:hypothetical protein
MTLTSPPLAGTRSSPVAWSSVANTIVSSGPQDAPRGLPETRVMLTAGPPVTETFLISPWEKYAIQRPSGEKNGVRNPPGVGRIFASS